MARQAAIIIWLGSGTKAINSPTANAPAAERRFKHHRFGLYSTLPNTRSAFWRLITSWSGINRLMNFLGIRDYDSLVELLVSHFFFDHRAVCPLLALDAELGLGLVMPYCYGFARLSPSWPSIPWLRGCHTNHCATGQPYTRLIQCALSSRAGYYHKRPC